MKFFFIKGERLIMSNLSSFGLEDLHVGIHKKVRSEAGSRQLRSLMSGPIADSNNTGVTYFAMEAMNLLGDSDKFGIYAAQGLEQLDHDVRVLQSVKARYGIEKLNPYTFGMEGDKFDKFKDVMKKIWAAIIEAFKRMIQAIANFLRSIANFFGSAIAKAQSKLYLEIKDKSSDVLTSNAKFKGSLPNQKPLVALSDISRAITGALPQLDKFSYSIDAAITKPFTETGNTTYFNTQIKDDATKSITAFKDKHGADGGKGLSNPRKDVIKLFWGNETGKAAEITVGDFFKKVGIDLLSETTLLKAKVITKTTQQVLKASQKGLNMAIKGQKQMEKLGLSLTRAGAIDEGTGRKAIGTKIKEQRNSQKAAREIQGGLTWQRMFCGYATGLILNGFSQFLKARSYAATAAKKFGKGGKKAKKED